MPETKLQESWPKPKEAKQPKVKSRRLDEKFEAWAKKNGINIVEIPVMKKKSP